MYHLGNRIREKLAGSDDSRDRALLELTWDYPVHGERDEPSAEAVLQEINGYDVASRSPLSGFAELRDDGSTACGCWIYSGVFAGGVNLAARRRPGQEQDWVARDWGWVWPMDRRILYNRASADPEGRPWSARKAYVWWDEAAGEWTGHDVPDFEKNKPPSYRPPKGASGPAALAGDDAFIMQGDGKAWLYVPLGLVDGPLPTHYEPAESPVRNPLYGVQANPTRMVYPRRDNPMHPPEDAVFPYVFTTSRLTEHHTAGGMSRTLAYLSELQPEMFVEVSPALAAERGLDHLGWAHVVTARAAVEARVLVTERLRPLRIEGRTVHQVWLPYHWGSAGLVTGDSANDLFGIVLDPNVLIQESKVGTCDVRPGRRPTGRALAPYLEDYRRRAGIVDPTEET
jgi:formate dehydrogenase major subunit